MQRRSDLSFSLQLHAGRQVTSCASRRPSGPTLGPPDRPLVSPASWWLFTGGLISPLFGPQTRSSKGENLTPGALAGRAWASSPLPTLPLIAPPARCPLTPAPQNVALKKENSSRHVFYFEAPADGGGVATSPSHISSSLFPYLSSLLVFLFNPPPPPAPPRHLNYTPGAKCTGSECGTFRGQRGIGVGAAEEHVLINLNQG